jgi:DNA-binding protein Fis
MSAGSARPLEDAFRIAQHDMVTWVASLCGIDLLDAYQLVTQAVESPLANVCDTNYTSVAKIAKRYLGSAGAAVAGAAMADTVMAGAHARLRELAAEYRG